MNPPTSALERAPLARCPFCGGEASDTGHTQYSRALADTWWADGSAVTETFFVNCIKCGATSRSGLLNGFQTKAEAIAAWNRRPLEGALARRAEAAETQVEELKHEAELFDADHADQNHMVNRIADLIGLPHDQELDIIAFELWFSANAARALLTPIAEGR